MTDAAEFHALSCSSEPRISEALTTSGIQTIVATRL